MTGVLEKEDPDFEALNSRGFTVIPKFSHLARAHSADGSEKIYRRSYNYDEIRLHGAGAFCSQRPDGGSSDPGGGVNETSASISDSGQLFVSFQKDVERQFVPIQQRLADLDILNTWTTPVASAVFAIPPGCEADGFVGEEILA